MLVVVVVCEVVVAVSPSNKMVVYLYLVGFVITSHANL